MPDFGQELSELDFENIIGGPLSAVVEAQAVSAMSTIDFIQDIGLKLEDGKISPIMAKFEYFKQVQNDDGAMEEALHTLNVPVLSIVPIPYITFNDLWINFNATLNSVERRTFEAANKTVIKAKGRVWGVKFKGKFARKKEKKGVGTVEKTYNMSVKVHAVQDEMPEGMERVVNILEQMATSTVRPYNAVKSASFVSGSDEGFIQSTSSIGHGGVTQIETKSNGSGYHTTSSSEHPINSIGLKEEIDPTNSVRILQTRIRGLGCKDDDGNGPVTDGKLGRKTYQSLSYFYENMMTQNQRDSMTTQWDTEVHDDLLTNGNPDDGKWFDKPDETDWSNCSNIAGFDELVAFIDEFIQNQKAFTDATVRFTASSDIDDEVTVSVVNPGLGFEDGSGLPATVDVDGRIVNLVIGVSGGKVTSVELADENVDAETIGLIYTRDTFQNVPLSTNGMGVGLLATVAIQEDGSISVSPTSQGANYEIGDKLFIDNSELGGVGNGFEAEVISTDSEIEEHDTYYICAASSGSGEDLRVRLLMSSNGDMSLDSIIEGGRDYSTGEVDVRNISGPGTAKVNIERVG